MNTTTMTPSQSKRVTPTAIQGLTYPYTVHRMYLCGHPDEYIKVDRTPDTNPQIIIHTIVPQLQMTESRIIRPYRQMFQRCTRCAEVHRDYARHPRSLAAHRRQFQNVASVEKNGFIQVLSRERLFQKGKIPIHWPDEQENDFGYDTYRRMKKLHENTVKERDSWLHDAIPYLERFGRRIVKGPKREGNGEMTYVVQTAVDSMLARGLGHKRLGTVSSEAPSPPAQKASARNQAELEHDMQAILRPTAIPPRTPHTLRHLTRAPSSLHQPPRSTLSGPRLHSSIHRATFDFDEDQIARNRGLALQHLEGHLPTATRHSDSAPTSQLRSLRSTSPAHDDIPLYIRHQRPFGPTRSSGSTTLSHGDEPRGYDRRLEAGQHSEPGVSINDIMETLFPSSRFGLVDEGEEIEEGGYRNESVELGRDTLDRSTEWGRHFGRGGRGRGSKGSLSRFESQRYSGAQGR